MRSRRSLIALAVAATAALLLPLGSQADTVEVAGVKYDTQAEVGGKKLVLNGAGIRYAVVIKVYAAGLYLSEKTNDPDALLAMAGPKRLHIVALRDIDGNDLGKKFTKGMEANAPREEFVKSINGVLKVAEHFAAKKELAKGESFTVDYIPGVGSQILINGKVAGDPIKEPEFFTALMRIWLGKSPADDSLKEALLGIERKRRR
ncbi:chalcone isomerase family protein [Pelomonas sp. SE-A7]|uniref:chalcone isomerase family protein n=1 Tax=Pelomonas sp. SE-A7 TaxID=3054953 RepID=UPI00259CC6BE|nr:chalcone isomerase family protein [Pelomonas sp. SE-A7]MDM4766839.1 chalcone isomerase family protein [Pelomonas sp. SE-A7]